jgi:thioredoxin-related protein
LTSWGFNFMMSGEFNAIVGEEVVMRILTLVPVICALTLHTPCFANLDKTKPKFPVTENFEKAQELARAHDIPLILIFSAQDFCMFSQKLYDKILFTQEFADEVNKKFVFVKIDFQDDAIVQKEKLVEQHIELKKRFCIQDFPQIVLLDPSGLEIAKLGYSEEIPMEYGKRLVSLWDKYKGLQKDMAVPKRLSFEKLKEIFIEAKEMGAFGLLHQAIELGQKMDKECFFLIEAYRYGEVDTKKKLREKIASLPVEHKDKVAICMDLIDFSECPEEKKEKILSSLREKTAVMKDKGVDVAKIWAHMDALLEQESLR